MFDWLTDLYGWITSLPSRMLDVILKPIADYIDTLSPISSTPSHFFVGLSNDILMLANLLSIPACMGIIVSAYLIRFTLQLIPFVRLGS